MRTRRMDPFTSRRQMPRPLPAAPIFAPTQDAAEKKNGIGEILSKLKKDDYILGGIIATLIFEGCDDYILLAALGYLFLVGFWDSDPIAALLENFLQ